MSVSELKRRRTFAVISHPDAGKTTLTEKLLLFSGAIQIAGTVKGRKSNRYATSDWMEIEKQRGISVASSVMQFEYGDAVINLLDTPGHEDFSEDTYRVLTAVDAAVMVIDGANGVEAQTLKLLEVCRSRKTPIVTFINKLDREVREPLELLDEIEQHLGVAAVPFTWPIGMGKEFQGVYDIQRDQVRVFRAGQDKAGGEVETLHALGDEEGERRFGHSWVTREGRDRPDHRRVARVRPRAVPRRPAIAGAVRLGDQQLRREGNSRRAGRSRAAAVGAHGRAAFGGAG